MNRSRRSLPHLTASANVVADPARGRSPALCCQDYAVNSQARHDIVYLRADEHAPKAATHSGLSVLHLVTLRCQCTW